MLLFFDNRRRSRCRFFCTSVVFAASLAFLGGCLTAHKKTTSAQINQKGATFLASESAQQRQQEIKQATKLTQQTSDSGIVRVVKPRVFWMGVFREGNPAKWPEASLVRHFEAKLREEVEAKIAEISPAAIDLRTVAKGDSPAGTDGLIALLALSSESRFWYPDPVVKGSNRLVVRITGQLLFIDSLAGRVASGNLNRVGWQVVSSYPVAIDMLGLNDAVPAEDDEVWKRIAADALFGSQRAKDGKALSIRDQLIDQLKSDALAPRGRSGLAPVAVVPAIIKIVDVQDGLAVPEPATLLAWTDDLGASLARYLSTGSGLFVSPYIPGGGQKILLSPVLGQAVAGFAGQRGDEKDQTVMSAELQPPSYTVQFEVTGLTRKDSIPQNPNRARIAYGFTGRLMTSQDGGGGKRADVQTWDFVLPVPEGSPLPAPLKKTYSSLIDVNILRSTYQSPPAGFHDFWWRDSLEQALFQITREMFYPNEDLANRFAKLRSDWSRLMQVPQP